MKRVPAESLTLGQKELLKILNMLEEKCDKEFSKLTNREGSLAKTNLEQAFMWANRAVCMKQDTK